MKNGKYVKKKAREAFKGKTWKIIDGKRVWMDK